MKPKWNVFFDTLKKSRSSIAAAVFILFASAVIFFLYRLPLEPFIYVLLLAFFLGLAAFFVSFAKELSKAKKRELMIHSELTEDYLPEADTLAEADYQEMIRMLKRQLISLQNEYASQHQDEVDYYTAWVHQIKTPIAVMRMELGACDEENRRVLEAEVFRIEQYVDMVLQFIRLDGGSDLVVKEYPLDELIRETVRKFAPQFVAKRLGLCYEGTDLTVITDKKWFSCILEQIISNAIKYTPSGNITITADNGLLSISDTGIGIAPEDIPRVFEKGFTGENGRLEKRSSGLGLYLCRKASDLLSIPLSVESTVGSGSRFSLDLSGKIKNSSIGTFK